jgi:hypothetical protein
VGAHLAWAQQEHSARKPATVTHIASPGAFLGVQCRTANELIQQFRKSPRLTRLYARHFGIPPAELYPFLRDNLRLVRLTADKRVTMYGATEGEKIYQHTHILPSGTRVWALPTGTPLLRWLCNNPLRADVPGYRPASFPPVRAPIAQYVSPDTASPLPVPPTPIPDVTEEIASATDAPQTVITESVDYQPVAAYAVPLRVPTAAPLAAARPSITSARQGRVVLPLALPLAFTTLFLTQSASPADSPMGGVEAVDRTPPLPGPTDQIDWVVDREGSTSPGVPVDIHPGTPPPNIPDVPEPGGAEWAGALLLVVAGAVAGRRIRSSRRRRRVD